jgi:transcription termination factor NusB
MEGWNYFNYFTEIEEYFWKKRGAHLLVSPLDWAIMETWHAAGIPLECVLKGIDRASESYARSRRGGGKPMKTLAYCADAVLESAEEMREAAAGKAPSTPRAAQEPFSREEIRAHFEKNGVKLREAIARTAASQGELSARLAEVETSLAALPILLDSPAALDLEDLERRLSVLDDKVFAALTAFAGDEILLRARREIDAQLAAHRRKWKAEQLAAVEKQYLQKRLLEEFELSRLSLFYLS